MSLIYLISEKSGGLAFGPNVRPICLPSANLNSNQFSNLTITGWGKVNYDGFSTATERGLDELQDAKVPVINQETCSSDKVS